MLSLNVDPEIILLVAVSAAYVAAVGWLACVEYRNGRDFQRRFLRRETAFVVPPAEETAASIARFRRAVARLRSVENRVLTKRAARLYFE